MLLKSGDLHAFVAESDLLGGPGTPAREQCWLGIEYRPDTVVDETLDPFSEAYVAQQLAVYREMSLRDFDQNSNEHITLAVDAHVAAINPYDHRSPGGLAMHIERLSRAFRFASAARDSRFLVRRYKRAGGCRRLGRQWLDARGGPADQSRRRHDRGALPRCDHEVVFGVQNFRPQPLLLVITDGKRTIHKTNLPGGRSEIELPREAATGTLHFVGETWSPAAEIGNGYTRRISMHLQDVSFL